MEANEYRALGKALCWCEDIEKRLDKALSVIGNLEQRIKELEAEVFVARTQEGKE